MVAGEEKGLSLVGRGCIRTAAGLDAARRLERIFQELTRAVETFRPDLVAVEELFFNTNVRSALAVGQARGVVLLVAAQAGLEVVEYNPLQVKTAVTGYGRADKKQVAAMVTHILGLPAPPRPDDVTDALAVAICGHHTWHMETVWRSRVRET